VLPNLHCQVHENFFQVFGSEKARRWGQDYCEGLELHLNPTDDEWHSGDFSRVETHRQLMVRQTIGIPVL
jgi:hypothetical protein